MSSKYSIYKRFKMNLMKISKLIYLSFLFGACTSLMDEEVKPTGEFRSQPSTAQTTTTSFNLTSSNTPNKTDLDERFEVDVSRYQNTKGAFGYRAEFRLTNRVDPFVGTTLFGGFQGLAFRVFGGWRTFEPEVRTEDILPATPGDGLTTLYILASPDLQSDLLLTTSITERNEAIDAGYINVGFNRRSAPGTNNDIRIDELFVYQNPAPGRFPIYRLINDETGIHFFSINLDEVNNAINNFGFRLEGGSFEDSITGYVLDAGN